MLQSLKNIFHLGVKEIRSLLKDWLMMALIIYSFTYGIVVASKAQPDSLNNATIVIVDDDQSQLTKRLADSFLPPMFLPAKKVTSVEIDPLMDQGKCTFAVVFPPDLQKNLMSGKEPEIQVNIDATRMSQAFTGSGYITEILKDEISKFMKKEESSSLASYVIRKRFNPNLTQSWFTSVMQLVNNITMLAIILTGSALIRERENGTLEHLLVMPVTAFEIMMSKIWSMMFIVLIASAFSLFVVIRIFMEVPIEGSAALFLFGVALHLFAVTSLGIFLACISQNMPQLGMLLILVYLPMQMLSGSSTPYESMPKWVQNLMEVAPTTHFVRFSQAILYRGAGIEVVWEPFMWLVVIGGVLFLISLAKFRRSVA
ncbi:MAG: ABC transporter permease [Lentisphaeria bacterium]|nr:ABC transporter permease [Lentisphaeria bacterium]